MSFVVIAIETIFFKLPTSKYVFSMRNNCISLVMASNPWFGMRLSLCKDDRYSLVNCKLIRSASLLLNGAICNAFSFPKTVTQWSLT